MPPGPRSGGISAWAVTAFILGVLAVVPGSAIAGLVALRRTRRVGERGTGLAIAGLILSAVGLAVFVAVSASSGGHGAPSAGRHPGSVSATSASAGSGEPSPGPGSSGPGTCPAGTGPGTDAGSVGVLALATGDCFDNPADTQDIESVTAIPCSQAHDSQVFAKFDLSGNDDSYPGQAAVTQQADTGCNGNARAELATWNRPLGAPTSITDLAPTAYSNRSHLKILIHNVADT
jgi:hypothetical protein